MIVRVGAGGGGKMAVGRLAGSVEQWRRYLTEYSADVVRCSADGELELLDDRQRASGWLGFDGADATRLAALEQRLGVALPPSYRAFLAVSDGWLHLGPFMETMRTTGTVGWLRDTDQELWELLREEPQEVAGLADRALLVSCDGDATYWLLDPGDVATGGEWAAYVWASWYPGLDERHESFAALVERERASFEELSGREGRPVRPEGAGELVAAGRDCALRGDVDGAAEAFARATVKGSGAAAYLAVMLKAFLEPSTVHHAIRNDVLGHPHVLAEVGRELLRAQAVPLFLHRDSIARHRQLFAGILTPEEIERIDTFTPPVLPEPAAFQAALDHSRRLLREGRADEAWLVVEAALPGWHSDSPYRIAPVILLTDPDLRQLITEERARSILTTPTAEAQP